MSNCLILVAGGRGNRMGTTLPKQFLELNGIPIILRSLNKFLHWDNTIHAIVALPDNWIQYWNQILEKFPLSYPVTISSAGETRFHTVQKALQFASENDLIAVHDAVRPLVSTQTIQNCYGLARKKGTAVPVIEMQDSLREISETGNKSVNRELFRIVQTPQVFSGSILKKAYLTPYLPAFTDDASVVEYAQFPIHLCQGNRENIKITTPSDLRMAESFLTQ